MVVKEAEELKHVTKKKTKVIEWVERTPADYLLEEMASLRETIRENVQSQYTKSVRKATHIRHLRDISLVPGSGVYEFTASQLMPMERKAFTSFLVCMSLAPHHSTSI